MPRRKVCLLILLFFCFLLNGFFTVCSLLSRGVVALFDPIESSISSHIQSICDSLDIPHIEARWDFGSTRHDLAINLYPRPSVFARAYVDLVKFFGWQQFSIVYEEVHGLFRLQEFFKEAQAMNWHVRLHQFEPGKPYRETFWKVKQAGETNIVIDVANENIFQALKHVSFSFKSYNFNFQLFFFVVFVCISRHNKSEW